MRLLSKESYCSSLLAPGHPQHDGSVARLHVTKRCPNALCRVGLFRIGYCHTYRTPMKRLFFEFWCSKKRVFQHGPGLFAPTSIAHADLLWNLGEKKWTTSFFFRMAFFAHWFHWLLESRFVARNGAKTWGASLSLCSFYGFSAATPKKCCCHLREQVQKRHVRHFLRCTS